MFESFREFLKSRQLAYQRVFNEDSVDARIVLNDLTKFCRGKKSCFHPDPRMHAVLEGRREVFIRICEHLHLSPDELWRKFDKEGKSV